MTRTAISTLSALIFVALAACGKDDLPEKPQLWVDREAVQFGREFGEATYVGARPQESVIVQNGGLEELRLNVSYSGDDAFTIEGPARSEVPGKQHTFVRVLFAPLEARPYSGVMTLTSNAENAPTKTIAISGRGIEAPTGDGGQ